MISLGHQQPPTEASTIAAIQPTDEACPGVLSTAPSKVAIPATAKA